LRNLLEPSATSASDASPAAQQYAPHNASQPIVQKGTRL